MREVADITIKFEELEDKNYDKLIEFLEEENIDYQVIKATNQQTIYTEPNEPDYYQIWRDNMLERNMNNEQR